MKQLQKIYLQYSNSFAAKPYTYTHTTFIYPEKPALSNCL